MRALLVFLISVLVCHGSWAGSTQSHFQLYGWDDVQRMNDIDRETYLASLRDFLSANQERTPSFVEYIFQNMFVDLEAQTTESNGTVKNESETTDTPCHAFVPDAERGTVVYRCMGRDGKFYIPTGDNLKIVETNCTQGGQQRCSDPIDVPQFLPIVPPKVTNPPTRPRAAPASSSDASSRPQPSTPSTSTPNPTNSSNSSPVAGSSAGDSPGEVGRMANRYRADGQQRNKEAQDRESRIHCINAGFIRLTAEGQKPQGRCKAFANFCTDSAETEGDRVYPPLKGLRSFICKKNGKANNSMGDCAQPLASSLAENSTTSPPSSPSQPPPSSGEDSSSSSPTKPRSNLIVCNPLQYGLRKDGANRGRVHCVPRGANASKECDRIDKDKRMTLAELYEYAKSQDGAKGANELSTTFDQFTRTVGYHCNLALSDKAEAGWKKRKVNSRSNSKDFAQTCETLKSQITGLQVGSYQDLSRSKNLIRSQESSSGSGQR